MAPVRLAALPLAQEGDGRAAVISADGEKRASCRRVSVIPVSVPLSGVPERLR
jgi:hypothetical protein